MPRSATSLKTLTCSQSPASCQVLDTAPQPHLARSLFATSTFISHFSRKKQQQQPGNKTNKKPDNFVCPVLSLSHAADSVCVLKSTNPEAFTNSFSCMLCLCSWPWLWPWLWLRLASMPLLATYSSSSP